MFISFFPRPRWFLISGAIWAAVCIAVWYLYAKHAGAIIGLPQPPADAEPIIGLEWFWSKPFLWFYIYYGVVNAIFAAAWWFIARPKWFWWSVVGTQLILFLTFYQVQVSVAINNWYGPFWDLVQRALAKGNSEQLSSFNHYVVIFLQIACVAVVIGALTTFYISHYVFRWRTAMNDFYVANWDRLRVLEGASQRVQDDAMRFASSLEDLGVTFVTAVMNLIAFLPVLIKLSAPITKLPFIGHVHGGVLSAAILWSVFGTGLLAIVGIKLPGLNFKNQRVEAAYRKELVYGEDDENRATPPTLKDLFANVRKNYFVLYFHYMYFNVARILYQQVDNIFIYFLLGPSIIAAKITFGLLNQIAFACDQVRGAFQYLVTSWPSIVELQSIYKRLRAFEATLEGKGLERIEHQASVT